MVVDCQTCEGCGYVQGKRPNRTPSVKCPDCLGAGHYVVEAELERLIELKRRANEQAQRVVRVLQQIDN